MVSVWKKEINFPTRRNNFLDIQGQSVVGKAAKTVPPYSLLSPGKCDHPWSPDPEETERLKSSLNFFKHFIRRGFKFLPLRQHELTSTENILWIAT